MKTVFSLICVVLFWGCESRQTTENKPIVGSNAVKASPAIADRQWTVRKVYYEAPAYNHPYMIYWDNGGDSAIEYSIESKSKDTCIPVSYSNLLFKDKNSSVGISFWDYEKNLPPFDTNYKIFDPRKVTSIVVTDSENNVTIYNKRKSIDSFCRIFQKE